MLNHRDVIIGQLIWVTIALGLHSFSLYIHNDTLQAFGRPEDIFHDNSIQLKPVFAGWVQSFRLVSFDIKMLDKKVIRLTKYACSASLLGTVISLFGSYYHMHMKWSTVSFYKKFKCLSIHHSAVLFGLSSISWCGHQIHISVPPNRLLDSGIDPVVMPCPQDFLLLDLIHSEMILFGFSIGPSDYSKILGFLQCKLLNSSTGGVFLGQVTAHHFSVGIVFITSSVIGIRYHSISDAFQKIPKTTAPLLNSWHAQLSMNLAIAGSLSIAFANAIYAIPIYPYCASDYPTVLCLFYHHMWVGGFLIIGAGAHASIFIIGDMHFYSKSKN